MKKNMKRRLQFRFVLLSVLALIVLQALIVAVSIGRNYQQITTKADRIIKLTDVQPNSPEVDSARYFSIVYDFKNQNFETDMTHIAFVNEETAIKYAKKIIDEKSDKGYIDNYRYLVHREKERIHITFLSRAMAIEAFWSNSETLILISVVGIIIMTVILTLVSGKVVSPIIRNRQKQKEFITSASHELKTPLTVIHADAQLLETEIGENEWLTDIIKQTNHMTEMTQRLVYLTRVEEEQEEYFLKIDFPISDIAEDVVNSYRAVAQNSNREYEVNIEKKITYCGDEKAIREMMTALLDNAFKYGKLSGSVAVKLTSENRTVKFSVENEVLSVNHDKLANFTERFYRADTSDKVKGFGIGLSVAKVVAEAHNGKLTVEMSEENVIKITVVLK